MESYVSSNSELELQGAKHPRQAGYCCLPLGLVLCYAALSIYVATYIHTRAEK